MIISIYVNVTFKNYYNWISIILQQHTKGRVFSAGGTIQIFKKRTKMFNTGFTVKISVQTGWKMAINELGLLV